MRRFHFIVPGVLSVAPSLSLRRSSSGSATDAAASTTTTATAPNPDTVLSPRQAEFLEKFRARVAADEARAGDDVSVDRFMEDASATVLPCGIPSLGNMMDGGDGASTSQQQMAAPTLREAGPTAVNLADSLKVPHVKRGSEPMPKWLRLSMPQGAGQARYNTLKKSMRAKGLSTVCEEAKCPNIGECWGGGKDDKDHEHFPTATIMIMGDTCTRACRFCAVKTGRAPPPLDPLEPMKTAKAVREMGVPYIVITMVDRDDLADSGYAHVVETIRAVKANTSVLLECLVGDFQGNTTAVGAVANAGLDVYAHNIECVERITSRVRDRRAFYRQSLATLEHAKIAKPGMITKTSIMLGIGETEPEVRQALRDCRTAGVDAVTLGQYLQPSRTRMKVERYVHPREFDLWKAEADAMGFTYCASGPMVRSSYRAGEYYMANVIRARKAAVEVVASA